MDKVYCNHVSHLTMHFVDSNLFHVTFVCRGVNVCVCVCVLTDTAHAISYMVLMDRINVY